MSHKCRVYHIAHIVEYGWRAINMNFMLWLRYKSMNHVRRILICNMRIRRCYQIGQIEREKIGDGDICQCRWNNQKLLPNRFFKKKSTAELWL